jgi:hypothetical protein
LPYQLYFGTTLPVCQGTVSTTFFVLTYPLL